MDQSRTHDLDLGAPGNLPPHYYASDALANSGQRKFKWLLGIGLAASVAASVVLVGLAVHDIAVLSGGLSAGFTALTIACLLWLAIERPERQWYGGRAVAESIKSLSWRYATRAEPFDVPDERAADSSLCARLDALQSYAQNLDVALVVGDSQTFITAGMRKLRAAPLEDRKHAYLEGRISDQRRWYSGRAASSYESTRLWFVVVFLTQLAAFGASIAVLAAFDHAEVAIGVAAAALTTSAVAATWLQAGRFQEQQQAYALAGHELGLIATLERYVTTEENFSGFVADSESAISREHTTWLARRQAASDRAENESRAPASARHRGNITSAAPSAR